MVDKRPAAADAVARIALYRVGLPLRRPLHHARVQTAVLDEVVVQMTSASGVDGWCEIRGNGAYATGYDADAVIRSVQDAWASLRGTPLAAVGARAAASCNPLASALLDGAAHDALGRARGLPLWRLLGGGTPGPIPTHAPIGAGTVASARRRTEEVMALGFGRVKVRVGTDSSGIDLARLSAVRDAGGPDLTIVADANGAWDLPTARSMLGGLSSLGVAWLEQPTPVDTPDSLGALRALGRLPIWADESARDAASVERLVEDRLVDGVHLKLEKCGTIGELFRAVAVARKAGLAVAIGQMDQGRLGCALTGHLAAALPGNAYEVWGFAEVEDDIAGPLEMRDGSVRLPDGPGLGVTVALDERHRVVELS